MSYAIGTAFQGAAATRSVLRWDSFFQGKVTAMKRILSFLLVAAMCFSIVMPNLAMAYESVPDGSASLTAEESAEGSGSGSSAEGSSQAPEEAPEP